jgi:hypoxanthine phosphoribosyltransferase
VEEDKPVEAEAEFEVPTWRQIYSLLIGQAEKIRESNFKPDTVIAVSRGGWIPARVLADLLETRVGTVSVEFYVGVAETRKAPVLTQGVSVAVAGKAVLIVDDVADSGESLKLAKAHILQQGATETRAATLYYKPWSVVKPGYYMRETNCWVVFPWEAKETLRKIVEKYRDRAAVGVVTAKLVKAGFPKKLAERFLKEMLGEKPC